MASRQPFSKRAARASAACAIAAVLLFAAPYLGRLIPTELPEVYRATLYTLTALGIFACLLAALVLGLIALAGLKRHGRAGILAPACVGLVLSALMIIPILRGLSAGIAAQAREPRTPAITVTNHAR